MATAWSASASNAEKVGLRVWHAIDTCNGSCCHAIFRDHFHVGSVIAIRESILMLITNTFLILYQQLSVFANHRINHLDHLVFDNMPKSNLFGNAQCVGEYSSTLS